MVVQPFFQTLLCPLNKVSSWEGTCIRTGYLGECISFSTWAFLDNLSPECPFEELLFLLLLLPPFEYYLNLDEVERKREY